MKVNKWTLGLASVGLVTLPAGLQADEAKMNQVWTALSSTTISGYVDTSIQWNMGSGSANAANYAYGGPNKADGFNLNVVKLSLSKPLDEAQWAAGYQADLLFGPDAGSLGTLGTGEDVAIQQAYVNLRTPVGNGLDFKVGVFNTIIGYESFDSGKNPNYTRSYGYTIEPTTHTGILGSYQITEGLAVQFGMANDFGPVINSRNFYSTATGGNHAESYKTYMASISYTAPENWGALHGSTLYGGVINGYNSSTRGVTTTGFTDTHLYAGATLNTPVKELKVGGAFDYIFAEHIGNTAGNLSGSETDYAWNVAGYVSFQVTEKMSLHGRLEHFTQGSTEVLAPAFSGRLIEATATLQYDLWKNVISRVEFRWDHSADDTKQFGGDVAGSPELKNQYILAANLIYQF